MSQFRRVAGFCHVDDRAVLELVWQYAFDWAEGGQFETAYSGDLGQSHTHGTFYDAHCPLAMAIAWDNLQDGDIPAPLAGAWGQNGLPTEQEIDTARGSLRINILPIESVLTPQAHHAAAAMQLGLIAYDE